MRLRNVVAAAAATFVPAVLAQQAGAPPPAGLSGGLVQATLGLAVVLALIWGAAWLVRRLTPAAGSVGSAIRVVAAQSVGPRERVVLVQLGEQVLVLGVAPGSVTKLHEMKGDELPLTTLGTSSTSGAGSPSMPNFSNWLKHALERRNAR